MAIVIIHSDTYEVDEDLLYNILVEGIIEYEYKEHKENEKR